MTQWVKTHWDFQVPIAILYLNIREHDQRKMELFGLFREEDPDLIEKVILDLIADVRPQLAGGVLIEINFQRHPTSFEFTYVHPSLPRKKDGEYPPRIPLVPEPGIRESWENGRLVFTMEQPCGPSSSA